MGSALPVVDAEVKNAKPAGPYLVIIEKGRRFVCAADGLAVDKRT
jgi:hypothetical protein